ncbi:MAG: lysophospholipid acyltransferase family protein [Pseudomonadota bacterium]
MARSVLRSKAVLRALGSFLAGYLKLVRATSRVTFDPPDLVDIAHRDWPPIIAMWHGQHFMTPFLRTREEDVRVLISRHGDGEINAQAASRLGMGLIRGSGGKPKKMHRKGGHVALRNLMRALDEGACVALTADVPKGPARVSGPGIVMLARFSGRPIYPVAVATSRRITLNSWDKASVNLPFSRMALSLGPPILVPTDADAEALEAAQQAVTDGLDLATARAYAIVDRTEMPEAAVPDAAPSIATDGVSDTTSAPPQPS